MHGKGQQIQVLDTLVLPKVTTNMPANPPDSISQWKHLTGIELADLQFGKPGRVDMLLGTDYYEKYSFTARSGAHEASLLHTRRVLVGFWPAHFDQRVPNQQRTRAGSQQRTTS